MQRKNQIFLARLCGQAERYDEMVPFLKEVVKTGSELSVDKQNLLTTAFNNMFGIRRASWRIISSIEQNELRGDEKHTNTLRGYRIKIENELEKICRDVLDLLDGSLIPNASTGESKALYYKMKGDYSRYLAGFVSGEEHNLAVTSAYKAYKIAANVAQTEFTATHPLRLGLALNFSVFYYKILDSRDLAWRLAKHAFDDANAELDALNEEPDGDSILIMQLLCDNLTLWASSDSDQ
ncbi:14-3-3 domain-containing protein [Ilyonectria robusta]|uniref:14-3-3 domain-containing protein n=1 Tax=Ilyonectria robusta TaxID=1079257 RepID=UPI001E8D2C99|nr:14-3-3 domain-containing protein [Ilyonectria robusta]KAH8657234.1 14-3-3 domain-containing protein [Ilyonectria robusta]